MLKCPCHWNHPSASQVTFSSLETESRTCKIWIIRLMRQQFVAQFEKFGCGKSKAETQCVGIVKELFYCRQRYSLPGFWRDIGPITRRSTALRLFCSSPGGQCRFSVLNSKKVVITSWPTRKFSPSWEHVYQVGCIVRLFFGL